MSFNEQEFFLESFEFLNNNDKKNNESEQKTQQKKPDLISNQDFQFQSTQKLTKQQKKKKGEYLKSLCEENKQLKELIIELERKISTKEAENTLLQNQLTFFNKQLPPNNTTQSTN